MTFFSGELGTEKVPVEDGDSYRLEGRPVMTGGDGTGPGEGAGQLPGGPSRETEDGGPQRVREEFGPHVHRDRDRTSCRPPVGRGSSGDRM